MFERYGDYVERLIVRVLGLDAEVPDLINEVFARAFERIDSLSEPSALKGWIGSIALFTARAFLRDRRSRRRFLGFFAPEELPEVPVTGAPAEVSLALFRTYEVLEQFVRKFWLRGDLNFRGGKWSGQQPLRRKMHPGCFPRRESSTIFSYTDGYHDGSESC